MCQRQARGRTNQEANQPGTGSNQPRGEQAKGRIRQGAKEPEGEQARGRKGKGAKKPDTVNLYKLEFLAVD